MTSTRETTTPTTRKPWPALWREERPREGSWSVEVVWGACVTTNKVRGVRACMCHDTYSAHQGVEHDDMNVLCLGARIIGGELAREVITAFLGAQFSGRSGTSVGLTSSLP